MLPSDLVRNCRNWANQQVMNHGANKGLMPECLFMFAVMVPGKSFALPQVWCHTATSFASQISLLLSKSAAVTKISHSAIG